MILGAVSRESNYCSMGAVADWVSFGDTRRMRAWLLAMAISIAGFITLEYLDLIDPNATRIPYTNAQLNWLGHLLGGGLFGIGMTLTSGCAKKNLIRLGGGSLKALVVIGVAGAMAHLMIRTDLYAVAFHSWMAPLRIDLRTLGIPDQRLGSLVASHLGVSASCANFYVSAGLVLTLICTALYSRAFRSSRTHILGGLTVGLAVSCAWYLSASPWGKLWLEDAYFQLKIPPGTGIQSLSFVAPLGDLWRYLAHPAELSLITFGLSGALGIICGAWLHALARRSFRIEWFVSGSDFWRHIAGAALLGIGGVLALGCTIGQGVTGVSSLALGSFITTGAMICACALTLKIELYLMDD